MRPGGVGAGRGGRSKNANLLTVTIKAGSAANWEAMLFFFTSALCMGLFAVVVRVADGVAPTQCTHMGWFTSSAALVMALTYYVVLKFMYRCTVFLLTERARTRARVAAMVAALRERLRAVELNTKNGGGVAPYSDEPDDGVFTIVEARPPSLSCGAVQSLVLG